MRSLNFHTRRCAAALCVFLWGGVPAYADTLPCPFDAPEGFSGTCELPLRNGDFTEVRNVSNTRAIVWGHTAHWKASHPRVNLGVQYQGLWASQLFARGHSIRQDMPTLPMSGSAPSHVGIRFALAAPGSSGVHMRAFVELQDASGKVLGARSLAISPSNAAWQPHEIALRVTAVPVGARVHVAFVRYDDAGGNPPAITGVRAWQRAGE